MSLLHLELARKTCGIGQTHLSPLEADGATDPENHIRHTSKVIKSSMHGFTKGKSCNP